MIESSEKGKKRREKKSKNK